MDLLTVALIVTAIAILIQYLWRAAYNGYDVFERQGVPFLKPSAFFGTNMPLLGQKVSLMDFTVDASNQFPDSKVVGLYDKKLPIWLVKDPELIKQIGVKDFDHFVDHRQLIDAETDPLFGNNLFRMNGQKWKDMRTSLSPIFTSSKVKQMFELVSEIGEQMTEYFKTVSPADRVVEMKDLFGRFGLDVIASTNFGVKIDSLKQKENPFYQSAHALFNPKGFLITFRFMFGLLFPQITKFLKMRVMPESCTKFFEDLIKDTVRTREKEGIVRNDLVNLLMELRRGQLKDETQDENTPKGAVKRTWTDDELWSQTFNFFFAGFDTFSDGASFTAYEIARNPEVQEKLLTEVDEIVRELKGGPLTYEAVQKLKYMDMVISEGLRLWSPADVTDRVCERDYRFQLDGREVVIEKGANVWFAIMAVHLSEKYYENPTKFDPERFSEENKHKISSATYLPFGIGPRNCIGLRFALMEMKVALFYILKNFTFEVTQKTDIPMKIKKGFIKKSENGIWLELKPRRSS